MQFIPTRVHGVIDYAAGALLILAPYLFGFATGGPEQLIPQIAGALTILISLATRYELGVVKLVPLPLHLALDGSMGVVLLLSPWLAGFADRVWLPHVLFGLVYIAVPLMTRHPTRAGT